MNKYDYTDLKNINNALSKIDSYIWSNEIDSVCTIPSSIELVGLKDVQYGCSHHLLPIKTSSKRGAVPSYSDLKYPKNEKTYKNNALKPGKIYISDNGVIVCENCAGYSALKTGRDISGSSVIEITKSDQIESEKLYGTKLRCTCTV